MAIEIITKEDLNEFRLLLLQDIKAIIDKPNDSASKWLKSNQVRQMLGISPNTLQNLRINGSIKYSKIGSIFYYKQQDIQNILEGKKSGKA
jgi:hypothetical protein